jgi:hypothetical protein
MLRGALPAAGPTGTVGRARATPELHGAVRSGTAGCGLNRDHGPCTGRWSYASTHVHLGTAGRETLWGSLAASGPEELRDSERELRVVACTSWHRRPRDPLGTAGRERAGGPARLGADLRVYACVSRHRRPLDTQGDHGLQSGPEKLRDSELSHGCRRDAVTVCFQYLVQQVTVSDDSTFCSELALLDSELGVEIRILPFELGTKSIEVDGEETRQSSYNPNRVWVSLT